MPGVLPVIYGLPNPHAERRINQAIQQTLQQLLKESSYGKPELVEMIGYYEIKTNEKNVLSLSLIIYSYTGGAHGITKMKSLTFDVNTGKSFALNELFKPNREYIQRLNQLIRIQIDERKIPLLDKFPGVKPDQDYYIADKSLFIYYQLYELTLYVYGFPIFPISVYQLQSIVKEKTPLGAMLPNQ
jgi:Deacetylase PdaC/Protein of unknown function (DUF3298)